MKKIVKKTTIKKAKNGDNNPPATREQYENVRNYGKKNTVAKTPATREQYEATRNPGAAKTSNPATREQYEAARGIKKVVEKKPATRAQYEAARGIKPKPITYDAPPSPRYHKSGGKINKKK